MSRAHDSRRDQVGRHLDVIHLAPVGAISRVVIPRAYKTMIRSLNPGWRRARPLRTRCLPSADELRQAVAEKIERLRALAGHDLVAQFAPPYLPRTERQPEPMALEETLNRGAYVGKPVKGGKVVMANPSNLRAYQERRAQEAELAEHQDRVRRGQEAIALAALAGQEG